MEYSEILQFISNVSKSIAQFEKRMESLQEKLGDWDENQLKYHLYQVGVIPEMYGHDSSEEKLYAKYCDILVYAFFKLYGMETELYRERGDFPDVIGNLANKYKIVADAKAFRLSRTALNPKDYKIAALNEWRNNADADYACLVSSFFPKGASRVYQEAISHKITLLSYTHLLYIISADNWKSGNLIPLWELHSLLPQAKSINAEVYWDVLNTWLDRNIKSKVKLEQIKRIYFTNICEQGRQQIDYWNKQKAKVENMGQRELIKQLLKHMKVDKKIAGIQKKITQLSQAEILHK